MSKNDIHGNNSTVSPGTIVAAPDGSEWVVIDPSRLDDDLPTSSFHWLGAVDGDESRGVGKQTFHNEGWEVVE